MIYFSIAYDNKYMSIVEKYIQKDPAQPENEPHGILLFSWKRGIANGHTESHSDQFAIGISLS